MVSCSVLQSIAEQASLEEVGNDFTAAASVLSSS